MYVETVSGRTRGFTRRSDFQDSRPLDAFRHWCRAQLQRCNRPGGFPLSTGVRVHFDDVNNHRRLRRRAELDWDRFPDVIRTMMNTTYRSCISNEDLTSLDTDEGIYTWCDHMNEVAITSSEAGNLRPLPKAARAKMAAVSVSRVKSTGTRNSTGTTVPRTSVPGYAEAKRVADAANAESYRAFRAQQAPSQPAVARVIRSGGSPSDGAGCWVCQGQHYARDCPVRANPYDRR